MSVNHFSTLNTAVFSDDSLCSIPKGVNCLMKLSTFFQINASNTGSFEHTFIIAKEDAYISYLEKYTTRMWYEHQLHAIVVKIYNKKKA